MASNPKTKQLESLESQLVELEEKGLAAKPVDQFQGREFISKGRRYIDFSGTNYLSFDLMPEFQEFGIDYSRRFGPMWGSSRLEIDSEIYRDLEEDIGAWIGYRRVHLSHTITLMNFSVMPAIAQKGVIFADRKVHTVVWEAARLARDHGAKLERFDHQDMADLERKLQEHAHISPKLIAVDGVYSISSRLAPIRELQALAEKYDAWLYVDDAHGFGVLGEGGRGVIHHLGGNSRRTFYVSSFGKAFCTHGSFLGIPDDYHQPLEFLSLSNIYSAPISPYAIGLIRGAMALNARLGDEKRDHLRTLARTLVSGLRELGFIIENHEDQPIVFVPIGTVDELSHAAQRLNELGIHGGLRAYPVVPPHECGVRLGLTAGHTLDQIREVICAFEKISQELNRRKPAA